MLYIIATVLLIIAFTLFRNAVKSKGPSEGSFILGIAFALLAGALLAFTVQCTN